MSCNPRCLFELWFSFIIVIVLGELLNIHNKYSKTPDEQHHMMQSKTRPKSNKSSSKQLKIDKEMDWIFKDLKKCIYVTKISYTMVHGRTNNVEKRAVRGAIWPQIYVSIRKITIEIRPHGNNCSVTVPVTVIDIHT